MPDTMTRAVRDDLAKLAYAMARDLDRDDRDAMLRVFALQKDMNQDMAYALYVRGKDLARREKGRAE